MSTLTPGPRQTIARAKHPTMGEGIAVYRNGIDYFHPDGAEPIQMKSIDFGGMSSNPPRDWIVARTMDGERIELETTGRQGGDRHERKWSPLFGPGWLVRIGSPPYPDKGSAADVARWEAVLGRMRFDPDEGQPVEFQWTECHVGRLAGREPPRPKQGKAKSPARAEWDRWCTWDRFEFRDEPPADAAQATGATTPQQALFT